MILSRGKSDLAGSQQFSSSFKQRNLLPSLEDSLLKRDYIGAKALLEFAKEDESEANKPQIDEWIAFSCFHLGDYQNAYIIYKNLVDAGTKSENIYFNLAICMFYLGMYEDAEKQLEIIPENAQKSRYCFHLTEKLYKHLSNSPLSEQLISSVQDNLSLASMHYLKAHYQEAIDIYKKVLLDHRDYLAINVYLGFCFYKLDYYDMSQEILEFYLTKFSDSIIAINLKACNRFRLFNGHTAEQEIKNIVENGTFGSDLIRHNLIVFRNGEGALQVFPKLLNIIPEARLNLAIYYLKNGEVEESHALVKDMQPSAPHEYILKGVVHAALGQKLRSKEHIKSAQQNLHLVGSSATECDTIPGRQSMASAFFLYGQFEEVLVYMNSIRSYFNNDDTFIYNYSQAKCATGYYKEAEELAMRIQDLEIKKQHTYCMLLAKCHIHTGRPELAWNIFLTRDTNSDTFTLLQLVANECYKCEEFWVAAKAFDMLEKLDLSPENWEGKRGACIGAVYGLLEKTNKTKPPNGMTDITNILTESANSQADSIIRTLKKYNTLK